MKAWKRTLSRIGKKLLFFVLSPIFMFFVLSIFHEPLLACLSALFGVISFVGILWNLFLDIGANYGPSLSTGGNGAYRESTRHEEHGVVHVRLEKDIRTPDYFKLCIGRHGEMIYHPNGSSSQVWENCINHSDGTTSYIDRVSKMIDHEDGTISVLEEGSIHDVENNHYSDIRDNIIYHPDATVSSIDP